MSTTKPLSYVSYLKLDELQQLQQPLSDGPEHDEMLFIVIHQVYELWFKQVLHELRFLRKNLQAHRPAPVMATLDRVLTIFKTLVSQVDILETMTPMSFNSFRTRLAASSGFQSAQFRELEFRLGHKRPALIKNYPEESSEYHRLNAARAFLSSQALAFLSPISPDIASCATSSTVAATRAGAEAATAAA